MANNPPTPKEPFEWPHHITDDILAPPRYDSPQEEPMHDDEEAHAPTAAGIGGRPAQQDSVTVDDEESFTSAWSPELGFPDPERVIRVWADPDLTVRKVRLSLNWRKKTEKYSLDQAFAAAFMLINATYLTDRYPLPEPDPLPVEPFQGPVGWHVFAQMAKERDRIQAAIDELGDVPPTRWVGTQSTGSACQNGVVIVLGIFGQPVAANFDPDWLDTDLSSREIDRAVMTAYRQARKAHQPPTVVFGERELLAREHDRLSRNLLASFRNGVRP